jgi:hypothetical protein
MKIRQLFSLFTAISLTACGGGSGGDAAPTVPPPPPPGATGLVIDTANAKPALRVAYGATVESMSAGEVIGGAGIAAAPSGGFSKPFSDESMASTVTRFVFADPIGPLVSQCAGGGTETTTGNLANPLTISAQDTINVDYADCDSGFGEVLNGRMEMTITVFSGDLFLGLFLLETDVRLINFAATIGAETLLSNGDSHVSLDTTGIPSVLMSISGNSLTSVSGTSTETLRNFSTSQTVDTSVFPEPFTLNSSGTVDSTQLSGFISFTTPVTFQGTGPDYPFAGELVVTGDGNATIRLIALDAINVRIETDSDGDGTPETTEDTTWDDISM